MHSLYLAWAYIRFHKVKTVTLVACVTLIASLPLALELILRESERQLRARAETTPLVIGAKGSALDLAMSTLYFDDDAPEFVTMAAAHQVKASQLALPIPLYVRFQARGFSIVGTTLDYFDYRGLTLAQGRNLTLLGECVLGATVAERLGLLPGDYLLSSPETLFDLAGVYPLKMQVVGVLHKSHSPDDLAVFVDLKTAWTIEGFGHGHQDVVTTEDTSIILERSETAVTANAKLALYTEITQANLDTFHFHGDLAAYPLTAVIAAPHDAKAATILRGRYLTSNDRHQIIRPQDVIDGLLDTIFRIRNVLNAVIVVVGVSTVLALILVFALSLRLRQREIATIFKLGCRRLTIVQLCTAEIAIIVGISAILCLGFMLLIRHYEHELVRRLVLG